MKKIALLIMAVFSLGAMEKQKYSATLNNEDIQEQVYQLYLAEKKLKTEEEDRLGSCEDYDGTFISGMRSRVEDEINAICYKFNSEEKKRDEYEKKEKDLKGELLYVFMEEAEFEKRKNELEIQKRKIINRFYSEKKEQKLFDEVSLLFSQKDTMLSKAKKEKICSLLLTIKHIIENPSDSNKNIHYSSTRGETKRGDRGGRPYNSGYRSVGRAHAWHA